MKVELTEKEIYFLKQCVRMAAREGFYLNKDCEIKDGLQALQKIGVSKKEAQEIIDEY